MAELAARYPPLESLASHVLAGRPFVTPPRLAAPLPALLTDVGEIMDSSAYGALQPLFLESRALGWLAASLSEARLPRASRLPRRELDRMHQARDLLLSRMTNPPTLGEVATAIGTNEFALKRNFKAAFGLPVYTYLMRYRLAHACELLRSGDTSVKQIAAAAGYAHPNHFSTAFRRAFGMSPSHYRQSTRST